MSGSGSRSAAVKRLMKEYAELQGDPSPEFTAAPLDDNLFEWHFTIRGPPEAGFEGGRYHGRLLFPAEYPFKPPDITFLTPNGRFEVGKKICLSITGHHPEYWRPAWGVRSALVALISFLPTHGDGAIGSLDYTEEERQAYAKRSREWACDACGTHNGNVLPDETDVPSERLQAEEGLEVKVAAEKPAKSASSQEHSESAVEEQGTDKVVPNETTTTPSTNAAVSASGPSRTSLNISREANISNAPTQALPPALQHRTLQNPRPVNPPPAPAVQRDPAIAHQIRQIDQALAIVAFLLSALLIRRMGALFGDDEHPALDGEIYL
ncbi:Ubiquitin-conjugating enzyme E2 J1 [Gaertneriomyces sp. JEL0708]|nr:Ubiquitin-conjugating enzyme E2 J1 [Gaertneriomyces sp. JEL0708]